MLHWQQLTAESVDHRALQTDHQLTPTIRVVLLQTKPNMAATSCVPEVVFSKTISRLRCICDWLIEYDHSV